MKRSAAYYGTVQKEKRHKTKEDDKEPLFPPTPEDPPGPGLIWGPFEGWGLQRKPADYGYVQVQKRRVFYKPENILWFDEQQPQ